MNSLASEDDRTCLGKTRYFRSAQEFDKRPSKGNRDHEVYETIRRYHRRSGMLRWLGLAQRRAKRVLRQGQRGGTHAHLYFAGRQR
jgi:hypothetical protein